MNPKDNRHFYFGLSILLLGSVSIFLCNVFAVQTISTDLGFSTLGNQTFISASSKKIDALSFWAEIANSLAMVGYACFICGAGLLLHWVYSTLCRSAKS